MGSGAETISYEALARGVNDGMAANSARWPGGSNIITKKKKKRRIWKKRINGGAHRKELAQQPSGLAWYREMLKCAAWLHHRWRSGSLRQRRAAWREEA